MSAPQQPSHPTTVVSRDGKERGQATGSTHLCRMEGCLGRRITTRWADGRITHPCTKALRQIDEHTLQIL